MVLRLSQWGLAPLDFTFFHKPKRNLILRALDSLAAFGALDEQQRVTADGRRMAELPLAIRSSRLLLEAEKGGGRVCDRALKVIAILEARGIVSKEFVGESYSSAPFRSDLLNQLALWENAPRHRRAVSRKKLDLAREIYQELKKRLQIPEASGALHSREWRLLYRAILSAFADGVFSRRQDCYFRDEEQRQPERTSLVQEAKPEMIIGLPFDLAYSRENPKTGEKEEKTLPLLTFCSELSLNQLEEMRPFGFRKQRRVWIEGSQIHISDDYHFGGRLIRTVERQPDWKDRDMQAALLVQALAWAESNLQRLPLWNEIQKNRLWFDSARGVLGEAVKPFAEYLKEFLYHEMRNSLNVQDLEFFFKFHPGFYPLRLNRLLPLRFISKLRQRHWPREIQIQDVRLPVIHLGHRPFLKVSGEQFRNLAEVDALLPTGDRAGIILSGRKFDQWTEAVTQFNERLRRETFEKRWQPEKKPARLGDLLEIAFPLAFEGGRGKENIPFEYFSVPAVDDEGVFLVHFLERREAESYLKANRGRWEKATAEFKKSTLDAMFRDKGWKVRS